MGTIMYIIPIVGMVVGVVGTAYCFIQTDKSLKKLKRNSDVFSYRVNLILRCSLNADLTEKIVHKHTYEEMLQSSKPLEDSYWFTPEEIEEINNNIPRKMIAYTAEKIKSNDF